MCVYLYKYYTEYITLDHWKWCMISIKGIPIVIERIFIVRDNVDECVALSYMNFTVFN